MGLSDLNVAFKIVERNNGDFEGPKSDELICKAEAALGLKFPPSYRRFLEVLGCGDVAGMEFYGLINDEFVNSSVPNAIWLTLSERELGLPRELILVYGAGNGDFYAIDTSSVDEYGENPIVVIQINGDIKKIFDSFGSFMLSELKTIL